MTMPFGYVGIERVSVRFTAPHARAPLGSSSMHGRQHGVSVVTPLGRDKLKLISSCPRAHTRALDTSPVTPSQRRLGRTPLVTIPFGYVLRWVCYSASVTMVTVGRHCHTDSSSHASPSSSSAPPLVSLHTHTHTHTHTTCIPTRACYAAREGHRFEIVTRHSTSSQQPRSKRLLCCASRHAVCTTGAHVGSLQCCCMGE
jgi:hypothetical protein